MNKGLIFGVTLLAGVGLSHAAPDAKKRDAKKAPVVEPKPVATPDQTPTPVNQPLTPTPTPDEKAGTNESLQNGGGAESRPWAVGVPPERQSAALRKFLEGNRELNNGLFENATKQYKEALADWDHPAIHYNMALALLKQDQPLEVYDHLEKAVKFGPAPLEKDKFEHANEYLILVKQQIATIEITCKKPGAKISVDGHEVFTVGPDGKNGFYRARVRVGKHTFVAEKPGFNAEFEAPFIGPGEPYRVEMKLYTSEELTRYKRRWDTKWVPYAVIGGGVLLGLGGGAMHLSAQSSYDDYDDSIARCNADSANGGCDVSRYKSIQDSGDNKRLLGYVGYGVAGAAVITGAVLLYLNREESYQITADQYRKEQRSAPPPVSITPMVSPDLAGAMITGAF